jgi:cobalt-zinc-cadmium efflux system membrane fusion protein
MNTIYKSLLLVSLLFVISCKADKEETVKTELKQESNNITISKKQFEASGMVNGEIQKKQFSKQIKVNGKIKSPNKSKAIVSSIMSGTIGRIDLMEGQWIKKGQPLFSVTNPVLIDLQEQYLILQSKIEYLKEEQLRKEKLVKENLSPKQEQLLAQSEFQSNQTKYKSVGQKLKMYGVNLNSLSIDNLSSSVTIYSPISGYVSDINALRGQFIDPSTEVVSIDSKSNIYLALNIFERDALLIKNGQNVTFAVSDSASKIYNAKVHLLSPEINDNGMVTVHCNITEVKDLLSGMYATANLILENYESNALPEDAIVKLEGKNHILVLDSKNNEVFNYLPQEIEEGDRNNGYVEVLNSNELLNKSILVKGGYYLVN